MTELSSSTTNYGVKNVELSQFMSKVYTWMTLGILLSGMVAYILGSNEMLRTAIMSNSLIFNGLIIAQLACVLTFVFIQKRCSVKTSILLYLGYSLLTGVTFCAIFYVYTQQSIAQAFIATSGSFLGLSLYGYSTKRDLGPIGTFCMMGLVGMIIVFVLGMFIPSMMGSTTQMLLGAVGVLIFSGLTAYDTQRIKMTFSPNAPVDVQGKMVISGALSLYLNFINLFLSFLRLFGGRN